MSGSRSDGNEDRPDKGAGNGDSVKSAPIGAGWTSQASGSAPPHRRLGASPKEVEQLLGKPIETEPSGDGYTQVSYPDTNCSVELKGGRLASFLILGDPNYFEE